MNVLQRLGFHGIRQRYQIGAKVNLYAALDTTYEGWRTCEVRGVRQHKAAGITIGVSYFCVYVNYASYEYTGTFSQQKVVHDERRYMRKWGVRPEKRPSAVGASYDRLKQRYFPTETIGRWRS